MFLTILLVISLGCLAWLAKEKKVKHAWIVGGLLALALYTWVDIQWPFLTGVVLLIAAGVGVVNTMKTLNGGSSSSATKAAGSTQGAGKRAAQQGLPYTASKPSGLPKGCKFLLTPTRLEWEYFFADCSFAIAYSGRKMVVPEGSLVVMYPTIEETEDTKFQVGRITFYAPMTANVWKQVAWNEHKIVEEYLQETGEELGDAKWLAGEVHYHNLDENWDYAHLNGGSAIYWGPSMAGIQMPESVEGKGYSSLTAEAMVDVELQAQDSGDNLIGINPAVMMRNVGNDGVLVSARAIHDHFFKAEQGNGASASNEEGIPDALKTGAKAESAPRRDFPVQTGRLVDPLGVQIGGTYMSGDGELTVGLGENVSVTDRGLNYKVGGVTFGDKGATTDVMGMEVNLSKTNPFDTKKKEGKIMTAFGEKDDTEMTLFGPKKKKKKGGGFFD